MSNPAVTEDGSAPRAVPRLWSPEEPLPARQAEPPSPKRRGKGRNKGPRQSSSPASGEVASLGEPEGVPRLRYSPTIKELPADERPRERLAAYGAGALTTAELLAILIRVGNAQRSAVSLGEHLLAHFGNIHEVACAPVEALAKVHGIGAAKAAQIKAAIEFGNRVALFTADARPAIGGPRDVANLLMPDLRYVKKETLKSLLLDTKNKVIAIKTVSVGDLSSSIVHPREVYKDAVIASAASLIVAHNHPSGDPAPSAEDVSVTQRLMEAGEILGIELLDHIIIGDGTFVSLKERGKM
ncbi:MAG: DNA repair protein RadC [Armatimonadetes bacterium]|nr:DNA repair protein RadC [Armatimonadota bacterium]